MIRKLIKWKSAWPGGCATHDLAGMRSRILPGLSSYGMPNLTLILFPLCSIFVTWRDYFILFLQYCFVFYPFKSFLHDYLSFQMIFSPFMLKSNQRSYYCNVFFPLKFVDYLSIDFLPIFLELMLSWLFKQNTFKDFDDNDEYS